MMYQLQLQEFAIALLVQDLNPIALNADVLKYSGIIPADWELAQMPVYAQQLVQMLFTNGVGLVVQPNRVVFVESMLAKDLQEILIPGIAQNYVKRFSNLDYQAIGINPKGFVPLAAMQQGHGAFVTNSLLQQGSWREFGVAPVNASVQLSFTLERGQLNIVVNDAILQQVEGKSLPAALFTGNFNADLTGAEPQERLAELLGLIASWQAQVSLFQELVETRFMGQVQPLASAG